ncbi:MAG: response regulator [Deltaproteobacteria bacterium]|nr:response regulator [Deltaproteobacteria bacterium]
MPSAAFGRTPGRIRVVLFALILLLLGYVGYLVAANTQWRLRVQASELSRLERNNQHHARALGYFLSERMNDLQRLAEDRAVSAYFANKALGMSLEYGLGASLQDMALSLDKRINASGFQGKALYTRITITGRSGEVLADRKTSAWRPVEGKDDRLVLGADTAVRVHLLDGSGSARFAVTFPFRFKGGYQGWITGWIEEEPIQGLFPVSADMFVVLGDRRVPFCPQSTTESSKEEKREVETRTVSDPIPGTAMSLLCRFQAMEVSGAPWSSAAGMSFLAVLILGSIALALHINTRNRILGVHLEESASREKAIEEKSAQLEQEITVRQEAENELHEIHQQLEQRVRERTRELTKSNERLKREIEGRERAKRALLASERRIVHMVNATPIGVIIEQRDCMEYVNPALNRMFGVDGADSLLGRPMETLIHPDDRPRIEKRRRQGEPLLSRHLDVRGARLDGRDLELSVWLSVSEYENAPALLCFVMDRTQERELRSQLRQAQKMEAIGTLAGGIAHDFNNLLSAILGYTQLALRELPQGGPVASDLEEVVQAGRRAKDLTAQILTFSRQREADKEPVAIHSMVKEALKLLESSLPATIEIRQGLDTEGWVLADPTQVHQVVMNLATNAYQAMKGSGGVLEIRILDAVFEDSSEALSQGLPPGAYVEIQVRDTGPGIPPEILDRIFEPYFTTKSKGEGTGLGLSVVHGIVEDCGGKVLVETPPGGGTVFRVLFPRHAGHGLDHEQRGTGDAVPPRGTERILLVDDEQSLVEMSRKMLESLGYRVVTTTSSLEALEKLTKAPESFDLLVADVIMPGMTGDRLAREVLAVRPGLPIILWTGYSAVDPMCWTA